MTTTSNHPSANASAPTVPPIGLDTEAAQPISFPKSFIWGAASSAYQIEGAADVDGRGPSIWDAFCKVPGRVFGGHTGDVACDHYHRYAEDVGLMKQLGMQAYRFSSSWSRVLPEGTGSVNPKGLAFYDRLVDALLAAGIQPWLTLFHWDLPLALHHRGGWLNRDIAEWAGEYAAIMADALGDRVTNWMTINEPQIFVGHGYCEGTHPPGKAMIADQLAAAHNAMRAHGRMAQVIRARAKNTPSVGWAPVGRTMIPHTDSPADIEAARQLMFSITERGFFNNTWFSDPAILGHYPEDGLRVFSPHAPDIRPGDMELIRQPLDFYGANIYSGERVRAGAHGPEIVPFPPGHPQTAIRWWVAPDALRWGPRFLWERYKLPIAITENGLSSMDWVNEDGRVHDVMRIDLTARFLRQLRKSMTDGANVIGYFHWSILDNFEWAEGYKERFGLVHVDFTTLKRTPKDSAQWYAHVAKSSVVPGMK